MSEFLLRNLDPLCPTRRRRIFCRRGGRLSISHIGIILERNNLHLETSWKLLYAIHVNSLSLRPFQFHANSIEAKYTSAPQVSSIRQSLSNHLRIIEGQRNNSACYTTHGNYFKPKKPHQEATKCPNPKTNQSILAARSKKTTGLESTDGLTNIAANRS